MKILGSFLIFSGIALLAFPVLAEQITIGTTGFSKDAGFLVGEDPASFLVRSLTQTTIIAPKDDGADFELLAAESLKVTADYSKWSFQIKSISFHTGEPITANDIAFSLNGCRTTKAIGYFRSADARTEISADGRRLSWVDVHVDPSVEGFSGVGLERALAACSIIPKREAQLFGQSFGKGTNILGAGAYHVVNFAPGKTVDLRRFEGSEGLRPPSEAVTIRGFNEPKEALTALRLGTIAAYLGETEELAALSNGDDTLIRGKCGKYPFVARKGFTFACSPGLDIMSLRYEM